MGRDLTTFVTNSFGPFAQKLCDADTMLARMLPSARKLLVRAAPSCAPRTAAVLTASIRGTTIYSSFAAPAYCMWPPLEPDELVDQV